MRFQTVFVLPLILAAAACGSASDDASQAAATAESASPAAAQASPSAAPTRAVATLKTADGKEAGTVTLLPAGDAIRLAVQVVDLPAGEHGIHVHTVGMCEGPKFESAGGHWNPGGKQHGLNNPAGSHAGDMPNLTVGEDGRGIASATLTGGTVADLLDTDGAALVVHAKADDQTTDPSGDSGDRIACGVLSAG